MPDPAPHNEGVRGKSFPPLGYGAKPRRGAGWNPAKKQTKRFLAPGFSNAMFLLFDRIPAPVSLDSPHLLNLFERHFAQWPFAISATPDGRTPFLSVRQKRRGYQVHSTAGTETYRHRSAAALLCDVGIDLAEEAVRHHPDWLCLHCSAVSARGRLMVFPNTNRAGKSLLAASFLPLGARILADDLLAITSDAHGVAFGLPPRLRLPLPSSSHRLARHMESLDGEQDSQYRFLYAGSEGLASCGETQPLGAFIIPLRGAHSGVSLTRLSPAAGLQYLAYQFQMGDGQAGTVFKRAYQLCRTVPLWQMEYEDAEEAAAFLLHGPQSEALFFPAKSSETLLNPSSFAAGFQDEDRPLPIHRKTPCLRRQGVTEHRVDACAYLVSPEQDAIFFLNPLGHALWALLEEPTSVHEAVELLGPVYPQIPLADLERDMAAFFGSLLNKGLIQEEERLSD